MDILNTDSLLTEEEKILKKSAKKFVEKNILSDIAKHFNDGTFPDKLPKLLGGNGYLGSFIPEEYGGGGSSYTNYGIICEQLEYGDSGVRSFCSVQSSLVMFPIWKFGSSEQKKKWLPKLASGEKIGCFGLTEPDFGSNPAGMITKAKKEKTLYRFTSSLRLCVLCFKKYNDKSFHDWLFEIVLKFNLGKV